jgi:hypothetical protein
MRGAIFIASGRVPNITSSFFNLINFLMPCRLEIFPKATYVALYQDDIEHLTKFLSDEFDYACHAGDQPNSWAACAAHFVVVLSESPV